MNAQSTSPFYAALREALQERNVTMTDLCPTANKLARRVLEDYGAMFLAANSVTPPPRCVFSSEDEVQQFQAAAGFTAASIKGAQVELQPAATTALLQARENAIAEGLDITPRDGAEAARRSYADTLRLWNTRFLPALDYWEAQGKLSAPQTERLCNLPIMEQVGEVLQLEKDGIFFSKDFSKSVLYSIAAPGTSQHVAMLAFDVIEFHSPRVRELMAEQGWFQTVLSDRPHFTFLGLREVDLPGRGLKRVEVDDQAFWIPNI
ncbi:MAG: hypothetical protein ABI596_02965 [Pyrinomonadaceae bacterium]